jgi:hypothetical protein
MADRNLAINSRDVSITKSDDGTLTVAAPITSSEHGTEGTFTFTLTADMRLRLVWDGVGLTGFEAWSTQ